MPPGEAVRTDEAPQSPPPLVVDADLRLEVDGQPATLRSDPDGLLRLSTTQPHRVWAAAGLATGGVAALADGLADVGLRLEVSGSSGVVATLGADVDSRLGRLALGSSHVRPGPWAAGRAVVAGVDRRLAAGAVALGVVLAWIAMNSRRRNLA